ncbi:LysR family transcriptional regulator [Taibaiella soli]|uniref:LysR family transcriptional regulator n=1 Tax=Taibaiella soli TaxID=1649169 RepID=A0A2W2AP32_9BACT|nr:LysR family transcriptional regulator [Taibaiella soli]PZF74130.1 LysR family transcriptional regulator [Taibaiella soli]
MIFDFRLQVFHTVARRLSFTKAAEELFITQPGVTKHIRGLEEHFKTKLFERKGNSIQLTEGGKTLLRYTNSLEQTYASLEQEMYALSGIAKGTLTIGASTTLSQYVLPPLFADFRNRNNEVTLQLISGNTEYIEQGLLSGIMDLGFIEGQTRNKQIKYIPFRKDELLLVGRTEHPLGKKKTLKIADLQSARLIMREHGSGTLEVILNALKKTGIKWQDLSVEMQLDATEAIKSYLLHSDCLAFISRNAIQHELAQNEFRVFTIPGLKIERPFSLIHLQGKPSRLAESFIKFIQHHNLK